MSPAAALRARAPAAAEEAAAAFTAQRPCCQVAALRGAADAVWAEDPAAADTLEAWAADIVLACRLPHGRGHAPGACPRR